MARSGPRRRRWLITLVVLLLVGTAAGTWSLGWVDHWRGHDRVAATPPPRPLGIALPSAGPVSATRIAHPAGGTLRPAAVRRVLRHGLAGALGDHVLAVVAGTSGAPVAKHGHGVAVPASTNKLLTAAAVLMLDGPEHRFATRTVLAGNTLTLVGGGDPLLAAAPEHSYPRRADLTTLARQSAAALRGSGHRAVRLRYDAGLFTGPAIDPAWPQSYITDGVVSPISALWADEGRTDAGNGRVTDPAQDAASTFAAALRAAGVRVRGAVRAGATPAAGTTAIAQVDSPPLREIVDHVLETSDNEGAEVLAHQAGLAAGTGASFAGGVQAVLHTLTGLGIDTTGIALHDGSGLSREDRLPATALTGVLQRAAHEPRLAPIVSALPVAAFSGSLLERYDAHTDPGRGVVRAKTGTLTGVDALAGYTRDADGTPVVFAVMADQVAVPDTLAARDALDTLASALTRCHCG